ncbi:MAG: SPOR domain-containing protein [Flavobacteriaceae bacterium]
MTEPFGAKQGRDNDWTPKNDPGRFDSDPLAELARLIDSDPFADMPKKEPARPMPAATEPAPRPRMIVSAPPEEVDEDVAAEMADDYDLSAAPPVQPAAARGDDIADMIVDELESALSHTPQPVAEARQYHPAPSIDDTEGDPYDLPPYESPAGKAAEFAPDPSPDVDRLFADISAAHAAPIEQEGDDAADFGWDDAAIGDVEIEEEAVPAREPVRAHPSAQRTFPQARPAPAPAVHRHEPPRDDVAARAAEAEHVETDFDLLIADTVAGLESDLAGETYEEPVQAQPRAEPARSEQPARSETPAMPPRPAAAYASPSNGTFPRDAAPRREQQPAPAAEWRGPEPSREPDFADFDPEFDESGHLPPYEGDAAYEHGSASGSRRGLFVVGMLVGLMVLGGAATLAWNGIFGSDSNSPPPTIKADAGDTKAQPENPGGAEIPNQNKLVYDRLEGNEQKPEERVVSREEQVETTTGENGGVRVIGPAAVPRGTMSEGEGAAPVPDQPKRVKTVVVKPDGTMVGIPEAPVTPEPVPAPAEPEPTATIVADNGAETPAQPTFTPPAAPVRAAQPSGSESGPISLTPGAAPSTALAGQEQQAAQPAAAQPSRIPTQPVRTIPLSDPSRPISTQPTRVASAQPAPQPAAAAAPATQQPAPEVASIPAGAYVVQVASRKSEELAAAAASSIQSRYGSALGNYKTSVQRADLGDRGVFYRVGVGPMATQQDASALCGRLKSAGLDCFVRRN